MGPSFCSEFFFKIFYKSSFVVYILLLALLSRINKEELEI